MKRTGVASIVFQPEQLSPQHPLKFPTMRDVICERDFVPTISSAKLAFQQQSGACTHGVGVRMGCVYTRGQHFSFASTGLCLVSWQSRSMLKTPPASAAAGKNNKNNYRTRVFFTRSIFQTILIFAACPFVGFQPSNTGKTKNKNKKLRRQKKGCNVVYTAVRCCRLTASKTFRVLGRSRTHRA